MAMNLLELVHKQINFELIVTAEFNLNGGDQNLVETFGMEKMMV